MPSQSPLFHAQNADRYARQELIRHYQTEFNCRLIVMVDAILANNVTYFEELIFDADPGQDLHLVLQTPGGDPETAIRLVRAAQSRCKELTVVVPDMAKSAGTLLAMGAHHILMGPTSDLGPVDPQLQAPNGRLISCNDLINAVDRAMSDVQASPETYTLHSALLANVDAITVQFARSAIARTDELVAEALSSRPDRPTEELAELSASLKDALVDKTNSHNAVVGADAAKKAGLPVTKADPQCHQWQLIWRLWTKYYALGQACAVYEGERASYVIPYDN
ncbi:SDH family Clp fold serine proteinase [Actinocorallia longicatena]|uniref:Serine dehydrogenase proteinase n=1 Tax=Actinocorallia longicatena TaxID=111803 RepID=A0ABP6QE40_9ACTN